MTDPEAELIAVVDADYHADPEFLQKIVGYFEDKTMGFVQTPHDYREWEQSEYLRHCYWEYELFFKTAMVSYNERNSGITVGTMCVIRKKALQTAGGWSEWCLTEDSELAIRIHAAGYSSIYTNISLGKGLIPETFEGYKKQRFRWTAGPIQEIKHHFSLLAPWKTTPSGLTLLQKIEHFNHGFDRAKIGIQALLTPVGLAIMLSMLFHKEYIPMPFVLWEFITVMFVTGILLHFFVYQHVMGASLREALGGTLASQSLQFTIILACVKTLFTDRLTWQRTNKFSETASFSRALQSAQTEVALGILTLIFGLSILVTNISSGILVMFAIGLLFQSGTFLSSLYMAYLAERDLSRKETKP